MRRLTFAAALFLACPCAALRAQGTWDAILTIDPYPSPYYSDWDANPNISTLTIINSTSSSDQVRIHFNVTDLSNKVVVSGTSEPEVIGAGATVIFDSPYDVAGSTTHDTGMEEIASRTGRLPEGDYTACAVAADASGFVLAESCAMFTIVYPEPPLLLGPLDGGVIEQQDPLFLWTPVHVPVDYQLSYVMRVVEVLDGQTPEEALRSNIPHYQSFEGQFPNLRYPIDGRPFEAGKQYAWSVQALDQNGYAASANDGRSEIWTFAYDDGTVQPPTRSVTPLSLTIANVAADSMAEIFAPEDTASSFGKICSTWDTPARLEGLVFPVMSRFAFPQRTTAPAALLVRDTLADGTRSWAVSGPGPGGTSIIMLTGSCAAGLTVPRWVGIRSAGDALELANWVLSDSISILPPDADGALLKFGVAILSLFEGEVGESAAIEPVQLFLEGHAFEVKPGLNLFGALDAREIPLLWSVLENFYDDDENEIELQGFVGLNQTYSARLGVGYNDENVGEVMVTQERLVLRAALPRKQLHGSLFKEFQLGVEISVGDSAAYNPLGNTTTSIGTDIVPKIVATIVDTTDVTWTGSFELAIGIDWKEWVRKGAGAPDLKGTLRFTTEHEWQPWLLGGTSFAIGHPEIFLDINEGLLKNWRQSLDFDLNGRGSLIYRGEDIATVNLTAGRHAGRSYLEMAQDELARDSAYVAAGELLVALSEVAVDDAVERGDTVAERKARAELASRKADLVRDRRSERRNAGKVDIYRRNNRSPATRRPTPQVTPGRFFFQASIALGNMGLTDLLGMVADIIEERRTP